MSEYQSFLASKQHRMENAGRAVLPEIVHPKLFDWQRDVVVWATRKGRCAVFLDTGMGKTFIQLEWARAMQVRTLIIAPLSVARQTVREAKKIDTEVQYVRSQSEVGEGGVWITNYEMAGQFDMAQFGAVVLDESSILKALDGKTRKRLTQACAHVPYRLCCTATPAPNDHTELGNHAEFLGICTMAEMLATYFVNANKEHTISYGDKTYRRKGSNANGTEWRLKHHAESAFFLWLSSWAMSMTKPSDLGYDDDGFILPPLDTQTHFVHAEYQGAQLFFTGLSGIAGRQQVRKQTLEPRLAALRKVVDNEGKCDNLGHEQDRIHAPLDGDTQGTDSRVQGCDEGEAQCPPEGIIRARRIQTDCCTATGGGVASRQSNEEEGAATDGVQDNCGGVQPTLGETTATLRDLRILRYEQPQLLPVCGPLPRDGSSQGAVVHELQPRTRKVQGQPSDTEKSSGLSGEQWVIWCGLDVEQRAVEDMLGDECVSIYGSLAFEEKERRLDIWLDGGVRFLVSKPRVCGFGLNLQQAHHMAFFGLNDSWESFYQAVRREWRYGQTQPVEAHIIMSDLEEEVYHNVMRKDAMAARLRRALIEQIKGYEQGELGMKETIQQDYAPRTETGESWTAMLGDACERIGDMPSDSIDLSVYSPPFADLYTYSATERDLGNSHDWQEFFKHYSFIIREVLRVTKPGRLTCVHTSDIPAMAQRDGYIGVKDFPGEVIRAYESNGWVFVGRAFVQKNPQAQAIRVKSKALLFVQLRKDSADSRPALIDQVLLFRKPGDNAVPIMPVANGEMDNETWIEWAHGIWLGVRETDTLQYARARGEDDEKHICPLQLGTIERCIKLYSNPGETVLTPFGGIGSEAYMAVKLGRKAMLIELKPEYFEVAVNNLRHAESAKHDMFTAAGQ